MWDPVADHENRLSPENDHIRTVELSKDLGSTAAVDNYSPCVLRKCWPFLGG